MTFDEFNTSVESDASPVENLSLPLQALWWDRRGDWHQAHEVSQQSNSQEGDRVHAYLHRKEGDEGNASYWYSRAGESKVATSLDEEWEMLVKRYLAKS
ncbi:MAG: hypothetical protein AAF558_05855 [Verrucomicrobiota bacterium]